MAIIEDDLDETGTDELWALHRSVAAALDQRLVEEINKLHRHLNRLSHAGGRHSRLDVHEGPSHSGK